LFYLPPIFQSSAGNYYAPQFLFDFLLIFAN
jgi:hypothetical protein